MKTKRAMVQSLNAGMCNTIGGLNKLRDVPGMTDRRVHEEIRRGHRLLQELVYDSNSVATQWTCVAWMEDMEVLASSIRSDLK